MRRLQLACLWWLAGFALSPAHAQQTATGPQDALQWLQRVAGAAHKLSYSGTYVYRSGTQSETSRIVHVATEGSQSERLEVLDGSPREVLRHNDEVKCYLPERHLVIVEQRSTRRAFPALLPASLASLNDHYQLRKAGSTRIAGFDSQVVRLEPRDGWRFGHQFWIDSASGLLLKAEVVDERGESLESMAFTELRIGEPASADSLKSNVDLRALKESWQVRQARTRELRDDAPWVFRAELPGFRRQAAMRRNEVHAPGDGYEVLHWVFSDGVAAVSVFISPQRPETEPGIQSYGAFSVVKRIVDGHQVVVMGDVPPGAAKHFADGVGVRGK
jgi:sigma-E factor negative regulatory protein RseB